MAQEEQKKRHDNIGKAIHWDLCRAKGFEHAEKWDEHTPESVLENGAWKLLWDFMIQTDKVITARRPDLLLLDKAKKCAK